MERQTEAEAKAQREARQARRVAMNLHQRQAALYPELVAALREAHEALHQCHPSQERIPVGKGICEWGACKRLRAVLAKVKELEEGKP